MSPVAQGARRPGHPSVIHPHRAPALLLALCLVLGMRPASAGHCDLPPRLVVHRCCASPVNAVAFSPDGRTLAAGVTIGEGERACGAVPLWDVKLGRLRATLVGCPDAVNAVAFSPDGTLLAAGIGDRYKAHPTPAVFLWDAHTGRLRRRLAGPGGEVTAVAFSPGGRALASAGSDGSVSLWDPRSGRRTRALPRQPAGITSLAFAPNGSALASASEEGTVSLWDLRAGTRRWSARRTPAQAVAFSPDGKTVAGAGGEREADLPFGEVVLWDAQTGRPLRAIRQGQDELRALAFSPDGIRFAAGNRDGTVTLCRADTGARERALRAHTDSVWALAFSAAGTRLASAGRDSTIRLWSVPTGRLLATLETLPAGKGAIPKDWVAFTPAGPYAASKGAARWLSWRSGSSNLPARARERAYRRPKAVARALASR